MTRYFVGVDLGQSHDYTAIAVLERAELEGEWDPVYFAKRKTAVLRVRYLERMALGTPYPEVVERVRQVVRSPELLGHCHAVVDATGVGRPVVDLLRRAGLGCRLWPVVVTAGDAETYGDGYYRVPKQDLTTGVQVLLQREGLKIAAGLRHAATLERELEQMRVKVGRSGREQYGVWREGEHDDLVFATALGCLASTTFSGQRQLFFPINDNYSLGGAERRRYVRRAKPAGAAGFGF